MIWLNDFSCDDYIEDCCGEGIISYYVCYDCNVDIELTTDCKGKKEEDE